MKYSCFLFAVLLVPFGCDSEKDEATAPQSSISDKCECYIANKAGMTISVVWSDATWDGRAKTIRDGDEEILYLDKGIGFRVRFVGMDYERYMNVPISDKWYVSIQPPPPVGVN